MILRLDNVSLKRNGKWILRIFIGRWRKGKLGALRIKWCRKDSAVKYALLILLSNIRRDAGAWP